MDLLSRILLLQESQMARSQTCKIRGKDLPGGVNYCTVFRGGPGRPGGWQLSHCAWNPASAG